MPIQTYRLYRSLALSFASGVLPILLGAIGALAMYVVLTGASYREALMPIAAVATMCLLGILRWVRLPSTIEWHADGTVVFTAPLRTVSISAFQVESVQARGLGFLELRAPGTKLLLLNEFDRFHDFLNRLQAANPNTSLRGC